MGDSGYFNLENGTEVQLLTENSFVKGGGTIST